MVPNHATHHKCYRSHEPRYSLVADIMSRNRFQSLLKTCTLSITMKWKWMTNLQKLDQLLILSVVNVLWLNQWSITMWMSKLYDRKQIFQVYSNIIPKWSFKKLLRAGVSGIIYYFLIYEGKPPKANGYDHF